MANFQVIHTYLCGHFDSNPMPGAMRPEYVFVNSGCSDFLCSHTCTTWLKHQGTLPEPEELSQLETYSRKLTSLQRAVANYAGKLATADPMELLLVADIGFPNLLSVTLADDPHAYIAARFHLGTLKTLLRYARGFAKSGKTRPFFDFCMRELDYCGFEASCAEGGIINALHTSALLNAGSQLPRARAQWPGAQHNHQPSFGENEIRILRAAGERGEEILRLPVSAGTLHVAGLLIATPQPGTLVSPASSDEATLPATATSSSTSPAPSKSPVDLEEWIAEQEEAFVAELKQTAAKRTRKAAKRGRVEKLARVGTGIHRAAKGRLPTLMR